MPTADMSTIEKSATIGDYAFCCNINVNIAAEVASTATAL